jgi:hypothetical protein
MWCLENCHILRNFVHRPIKMYSRIGASRRTLPTSGYNRETDVIKLHSKKRLINLRVIDGCQSPPCLDWQAPPLPYLTASQKGIVKPS